MEVIYRRLLLTPEQSIILGSADFYVATRAYSSKELTPVVSEEEALRIVKIGKNLLEEALKKAILSVPFDLATQLFKLTIDNSLEELDEASKKIMAGEPLLSMLEIRKFMDHRIEMS
jgi:hypothetical protein